MFTSVAQKDADKGALSRGRCCLSSSPSFLCTAGVVHMRTASSADDKQGAHRDVAGEVGHLASDGRRAATAQVGSQTHARRGAAVEFALQILEVQGERQDLRISNLRDGRGSVNARFLCVHIEVQRSDQQYQCRSDDGCVSQLNLPGQMLELLQRALGVLR